MKILIILSGVFTLCLGITHIFLPKILGYKDIVLKSPLNPSVIKILFVKYETKLNDLNGIIWVMNHHASYVLISIGIVDIFFSNWLLTEGKIISIWIAIWWLLRSLTQFYLGTRKGDFIIMFWFFILGLIHFGG